MLDEHEDLPEIFPGDAGKILVSGTPAPVVEPEPEPYASPAAAPVAGAARTLTLLCHAEVVGTNGTKIKVENVSSLAELMEKLRASEKIWEGMDFIPEAGTPLAAHTIDGSTVGAAYTSLDEVTDKSKICIKVLTGPYSVAVEEAVPELQLVVMVAKNEVVAENKKMAEVSVASVEELCAAMELACDVTDANVAVFQVRACVYCWIYLLGFDLGLTDVVVCVLTGWCASDGSLAALRQQGEAFTGKGSGTSCGARPCDMDKGGRRGLDPRPPCQPARWDCGNDAVRGGGRRDAARVWEPV